MDKFFLAVIGVFMAIFAFLKLQLLASRKKTEKAVSETAKVKVEKDAVQTTSDITGALARKLSEIKTPDSPVVADSPSRITPLEQSATTLLRENASLNASLKENASLNTKVEIPAKEDTSLNTDTSLKDSLKDSLNAKIDLSFPNNNATLSEESMESAREQLKRIRQLRGL